MVSRKLFCKFTDDIIFYETVFKKMDSGRVKIKFDVKINRLSCIRRNTTIKQLIGTNRNK